MSKAAQIRNDIVQKRLKSMDSEDVFVYHMTNQCYKLYTMKKTLEQLSIKEQKSSKSDEDSSPLGTATHTRSRQTPRPPPSHDVDCYSKVCVVCGYKKHHGTYQKYRISENERAQNFLNAAIYFQDSVYTRTCDLQDVSGVFGADLYCHADCCKGYMQKYNRIMESPDTEPLMPKKLEILNQVITEIEGGLSCGDGFTLSSIRDRAISLMNGGEFTNRELKVLLTKKYGESLKFSVPKEANKSVMIFLDKFSAGEMADTIRASDPISQCAEIMRNELQQVNFGLGDKFCDSYDLDSSWKNITIPEPVLNFSSILLNFKMDDFEESKIHTSKTLSETKHRKVISLYQIMAYMVQNGKQRTPLHVVNGQAIHEACKSKTLITCFNHLGLSVSYDEIRRYHNDMASLVVETSQGNVPIPSHFSSKAFTLAAFDNFDHEESTLSGIGGTHDTVTVLFQDKSPHVNKKPNISESAVIHGSKVFKSELPCQVLKEFTKPSKKAGLHEDFTVADELFMMDEKEYTPLKLKDMAWSLARCHITDNEVSYFSSSNSQLMPSWSSFNSIVTDENVNEKIVGFLPILPYPVTDYCTVYTPMCNFNDVLK